MFVHATTIVRLKCSFHFIILYLFCYYSKIESAKSRKLQNRKTFFTFALSEFAPFWDAKVRIIFEITKNYAIFRLKKTVFYKIIVTLHSKIEDKRNYINKHNHINCND